MGAADRVHILPASSASPAAKVLGASPPVVLCGIAVLSLGLRLVLLREIPGPWIFPDELGYQRLAYSLGHAGRLALFDKTGLSYSPLYPLVLSPLYALGLDAGAAYQGIKVVNAVLMSLSVVPVYAIGRFVLSRRLALAAAGLMAVAPLMYYTALGMSENLAYPLFLLSVWAMLAALRRPSLRNDALLLVSILAASASRIELAALLPAAFTAIGTIALWTPSAARGRAFLDAFRAHRLLVWSTAILAVAAVASRVALGKGPLGAGGRYADLGRVGMPSPWRILETAVEHLAELDLAVGVIPFAAALLGVYLVARRRVGENGLVYAAVATSVSAWLLLETAFASEVIPRVVVTDVPRIHERYLVYLVPLFVIALPTTLRLPEATARPRVYAGAALAAAVMPALIPYHRVINNSVVADTFGLALLAQTRGAEIVPVTNVTLAAVGIASVLGAAYFLGRRMPVAVVAWVFLVFVFMSAVVRGYVVRAAGAVYVLQHGDWVDRAGPGGTVVLVSGRGATQLAFRETAYNNLSISRLYDACGNAFGPEFGETPVTPDAHGRLRGANGYVRASYAVVPSRFHLRGRVVARETRADLVLVAPAGGHLVLPREGVAAADC